MLMQLDLLSVDKEKWWLIKSKAENIGYDPKRHLFGMELPHISHQTDSFCINLIDFGILYVDE